MNVDGKLLIAKGDEPVYLLPQMANRHGLITGATGTGKTVTLKALAQNLSDIGVPCFLADVKGDVSGMAVAGEATEKLVKRLADLGITDYGFHACPVRFWDVYGEGGIPVRTTISEMGPFLLGRLLGLTEVQTGVLNIAFHVADDQGLLLLDLKDLRSMIAYLGEHAEEFKLTYGNISSQSVGAVQRSLLQLEDAGGNIFFGEPALDIHDWMACDASGRGYVNILDCVRLVQSPMLYSTFLLWMLSELYAVLPEAGDLDKPKVVFFFDEAHLLFDEAPKALRDKVEQVVKLIRSKGVGVYFITQSPSDIPGEVLAQLGNRVQHALRAYTPAEQKAVHAAAASFRENPAFDTEKAIGELGTGEALISFLDEKGIPTMVQRAMVIAPACSMGSAPDDVKQAVIATDVLKGRYADAVDRESAYELLAARAQEFAAAQEHAEQLAADQKAAELAAREEAKAAEKAAREEEKLQAKLEKEEAAARARAEKERIRFEEAARKEAEKAAAARAREEERRRRELEKIGTSFARTLANTFARNVMGMLNKR